MTKHNDDDPVIVGYSASSNISFHGEADLGITWGDWREMSREEQDAAVNDWIYELVDVHVIDEED